MKIFIYDEFTPEDNAMLQALYSRSPESVENHVEKVRKAGSGNFMEKFYVGYGHSSIADCGSTTLFIEGISILADKAIQDWPLYSGQETSTRYIDMSKQPIIDPLKTKESKEILDNWMNFYIKSQEELKKYLREKYPQQEGEEDGMYERAINARSFDVLRGFLPAGITTQLSWHTNLRQAWDKLSWFRFHPLTEVREIAEEMHKQLKNKYEKSFSHELVQEQEDYREYAAKKYTYYLQKNPVDFDYSFNVNNKELEAYSDLIEKRPMKVGLPHFLSELGNLRFDFILDYGSFRDIQRHRNGVCRMPLLTTNLGFHNWYLNQLPENLKSKAQDLISKQKEKIEALDAEEEIKQYYTALGFNVACRVSYGLPATVYVIELRSGNMVHPTLREVAHKMYHALIKEYPKMKIHADLQQDQWDARRGLQDIREK
ncbi:MAG: FAD-dependent thymidylate synthase [Candidatus Moranbacteria bacterium]|nr:FAD-dependent thymidylate synthase [Candidatus Moranbacteria bacterium]